MALAQANAAALNAGHSDVEISSLDATEFEAAMQRANNFLHGNFCVFRVLARGRAQGCGAWCYAVALPSFHAACCVLAWSQNFQREKVGLKLEIQLLSRCRTRSAVSARLRARAHHGSGLLS
jgi:hypothetical protein